MMDKGREITGMARETGDAQLEQALGDFRASVKAWSEAAMHQTTVGASPAPAARPLAWRGGLAWAMGLVLAVGAGAGAIYENHHQRVLEWQAQQQAIKLQQEQRAQAAERAAEMDQLMANVDRDVSQEVPDALEPLAQMMTETGSN